MAGEVDFIAEPVFDDPQDGPDDGDRNDPCLAGVDGFAVRAACRDRVFGEVVHGSGRLDVDITPIWGDGPSVDGFGQAA
ncbi:hypothetical protein OHT59_46970 [Streptomyces sp. NBC_00243]|uniref:hypothetical protein n=1 Tax=Streptomyces sp. NBC_00243 TaxID=2975688 RepID=UPI002DDA9501|nr:hypothetical protein [Streptomyces sp. NBC_00243]WRZ25531.1 hypothetical protein OHT59_46970 [Streptomyces sp. NBC_00243]